ncbi:cyclophilin-like fold protein [Saccharopolyspora sp. NPDC050642]|uniref:cyclophilin-like fold protein n=1 Tax=Saccharopolyspora sp. NPDC050642 TaxID=3157099 RepID=UPI0033E80566
MKSRIAPSAGVFALIAFLTACSPTDQPAAPSSVVPPTVASSPAPSAGSEDGIVGTVVRFTSGDTSVDVTIGEDSPATRDFLSMLPLTIGLEEFAGREKISYLPRELNHAGAPGSDPEDGDLIYFTPWGNLGFYYDASGIGYSDQTVHIGTYHASPEQLARLEGGNVTVQIVE